MKKFEKVIKGFVIASALMVAGNAFAVRQGTLGATSDGDIDIDVVVSDQILISGLADIAGPYVPGNDFTGNSPACVYRNGPSGAFDITMTSANGSGTDFRLNGPGGFVIYEVDFNDGGAGGAVNMDHGQVNNTDFDNADNTSQNCGGSPQSDIDITVLDAALGAVGAGTYSDTLTILVAPR